MKRFIEKFTHKTGLPPGTLMLPSEGPPEGPTPDIVRTSYTRDHFEETLLRKTDPSTFDFRKEPTDWIDYRHIDLDNLRALETRLDIHPLVLEDITHTEQLPKLEDHGHYLFIVLKFIEFADSRIQFRQASLLLGENWVISIHDSQVDMFRPIHQRLSEKKGKIRDKKSDYLAYALIDFLIDTYFVTMKDIDRYIGSLSAKVDQEQTPPLFKKVQTLMSETASLKRHLLYTREAIGTLKKSESTLMKNAEKKHLSDLDDHAKHALDIVESFRDELLEISERFSSNLTFKSNQIMKALTLIATLFMPLTFIAGIYGMNFKAMPELGWRWGYPVILGIMSVIAVLLLIYYKRKKWI